MSNLSKTYVPAMCGAAWGEPRSVAFCIVLPKYLKFTLNHLGIRLPPWPIAQMWPNFADWQHLHSPKQVRNLGYHILHLIVTASVFPHSFAPVALSECSQNALQNASVESREPRAFHFHFCFHFHFN